MAFRGPVRADHFRLCRERQPARFVVGRNNHERLAVPQRKIDGFLHGLIEQQCLPDRMGGVVVVAGPVNLATLDRQEEAGSGTGAVRGWHVRAGRWLSR